MKDHRLFVLIPAFDEAKRIGRVIRSVPRTIKAGSRTYSTTVVVVDDCSRDTTAEVAKQQGATVLYHVVNCGAGAATRTAMKFAEKVGRPGDYAVSIDADGQHATSDIEKVLAFGIESGADMVVGTRLHEGNKQNMPAHRVFGNWGLSLFSRILFGITTRDTQSGLRLFKVSSLPMLTGFTIDRYGFATDMLWQAFRHHLTVRETPITVSYSADTIKKGQSVWGGVDLLIDLLRLRMNG